MHGRLCQYANCAGKRRNHRFHFACRTCAEEIKTAGRHLKEGPVALARGNHSQGRSMPEKTTKLSMDTPHPLVKKVIAGKPPIAELIGFDLEDIGDGRAVFSLQAGSQHANPMGTLHGGVLCDLADAAMGIAFATTLAPDESFTTMSLNINFFRPVWQAGLRAKARVINRGKNVGYLECDVVDENDRKIAKANSTF